MGIGTVDCRLGIRRLIPWFFHREISQVYLSWFEKQRCLFCCSVFIEWRWSLFVSDIVPWMMKETHWAVLQKCQDSGDRSWRNNPSCNVAAVVSVGDNASATTRNQGCGALWWQGDVWKTQGLINKSSFSSLHRSCMSQLTLAWANAARGSDKISASRLLGKHWILKHEKLWKHETLSADVKVCLVPSLLVSMVLGRYCYTLVLWAGEYMYLGTLDIWTIQCS